MITLVGCEEAVLKYYFWNANEMQKHITQFHLRNNVIYSRTSQVHFLLFKET